MATSRTLKLSVLADVDDLKKKLKQGADESNTFGNKVEAASKKVAAAFVAATAAAAALATKLAIDGVKAAIEDEQSQIALAKALENATGATDEQIASVEKQISKLSLAKGVADDQLRPAFASLTRATGDLTASQDLLTLALDISAATGKDLDAVALSLGKAYDGNNTSLTRLGVGLSAAELKTMSFTEVQQKLTELFGGAADANANTYAGRIERLKVAFDEAKESLGQALLPIVEKFIGFLQTTALPALNSLIRGFKGEDKLEDGLNDSNDAAYSLGQTIKSLSKTFSNLFKIFNSDANTGERSGLAIMLGWIESILKALEGLIKFLDFSLFLLKMVGNPKSWGWDADEIARQFKLSKQPKVEGFQSQSAAEFAARSSMKAMEDKPKPTPTPTPRPNIVINNNVSGAIDSEGTARQIAKVVTESLNRGTGGGGGAFGGLGRIA